MTLKLLDKSFLVAVDKIQHVQGNQMFLEGHTVPIGQTYRSIVNQLLAGK